MKRRRKTREGACVMCWLLAVRSNGAEQINKAATLNDDA